MFADSWSDLTRIVTLGLLTYAALIVMLRLSGKRTLSKMNAFDFVVTVAMGSTLATIILSRDVSLADGIAALALLVLLQLAITWTSVRSRLVRRLVKSEPALLFHRGRFLHAALRSERVTEDEVVAAVRASGLGSAAAVEAVILETDGSLSVVRSEGVDPAFIMADVKRHPRDA